MVVWWWVAGGGMYLAVAFSSFGAMEPPLRMLSERPGVGSLVLAARLVLVLALALLVVVLLPPPPPCSLWRARSSGILTGLP